MRPWGPPCEEREYGGVLFVTCGSVGKPEGGDPRAGFGLLRPGFVQRYSWEAWHCH
jgi:hypothetical protein